MRPPFDQPADQPADQPGGMVDVLVVGDGHHGLATALGLARAGLAVELVGTGRHPTLPWTAVHHWSTLPGLEDLGVLEDLLAAGTRTTGWGLAVPGIGELLAFDLADLTGQVAHPYNLRVEDAVLRSVLRRHFLEQPRATCSVASIRSLHQHPGGATVELEAESGSRLVRARWVVAADGPASAVRRETGIAFEGSTWWERCVVALVDHDFSAMGYPDTTLQVDPTRGAVVERSGDTTWRYVFQEPSTRPEDTLADRIPQVLAEATGAAPRLLEWTAERMYQRVAAQFRSERVVLVGDAAHVTHRLIGHSSISGWFDVFTSARVLADVVTGRSNDDAVSAWAEQRRRVYLHDAVPASLSRKNLVTEIRDRASLDVELDQFRRARHDREVRRELLLQGRELDGLALLEHLPL